MKLTAFFLLGACLQLAAKTTGQTVTLNMKNAPVQKVFKEVSRQTGMSILYNEAILDGLAKVTIRVNDAPVSEVLDQCLRDEAYDYTVEGTTIVVKRRPPLQGPERVEGLPATEAVPPIDVKGRITNENGEPVAATITVKGTNNATATDADGNFVLKAVDDNATLVITGVSIETREIKVGGKTDLAIVAKTKVTSLNEVIVNKGYYTEKQRFSVGNSVTIKAADIEKQPVQNPLLALQGRVPGLEITQLTGMNGGGVRVRIHGRNSLEAGLDPLIIIDGVPFPNGLTPVSSVEVDHLKGGSPLNYISPTDIESIDILKDADATAIYGSRATNGAILITTKKGKAGKSKLTINLQEGFGQVTRKIDMMNTRQYLDMRYEAYKNDGIDWRLSSVTANDLKLWDTTRYTDWQKELLGGTARYSNLRATVSGGTTTIQYLIGATYNRQSTVFPGDFDEKRGALNFSISGASNNQKLRIRLSGNYMYSQNRLPSIDLTTPAVLLHPLAPPLYNPNGTLNWAPNAAGTSSWDNPLIYTMNSDYNNQSKNLLSSLNINYQVLPGLQLSSNFGYTQMNSDIYAAKRLEFYRPERRPTSQREVQNADRNMNSWIIEPQVQFKRLISKGNLDILIGATVEQRSTVDLSLRGAGYVSDLLMKSFQAAQTISTIRSKSSMYRYNAVFARLNYIWQDKYIVNFTARRDGSSRFGNNNKVHNFGSIGTGWIFSEERKFKRDIQFLSFGKLRASYGVTGNDQFADYSYLGLYYINGNATIPYQNLTSFDIGNIANHYLEWEEARKLDFGLDLGFLKDRINFSATYSRVRSSNQLSPYILPIVTGYSTIVRNFPATIQNSIWGFSLNTTNIKSQQLVWNTSLNLTIPRNKLLSFPEIEKTPYGSVYQDVIIGQPLGVFKTFRFGGVDPLTGKYLLLNKNGDPTFNPDYETDQVALISPLSTWYGGINTDLKYKGFLLEVMFQLVHKKGPREFYYYNTANVAPGRFVTSGSNQPVTTLNRWQRPGDYAPIARYTTGNSVILWPSTSDTWLTTDASYFRLKNLALSWTVPDSWISKVRLRNVRLYVNAQNLLTITNYTGLDPEIEGLALPPLRLITFGLQIEL